MGWVEKYKAERLKIEKKRYKKKHKIRKPKEPIKDYGGIFNFLN